MFAKSAILSLGIALGLGAFVAPAHAEYYVWYDTNEHMLGDIDINGALQQPPNYACGMRFSKPYRLNWIDYDPIKTGVDLDQGIDVWLPRPNCGVNGILIKGRVDNHVYNPPVEIKKAEIQTLHSGRWFDKDGNVKPYTIPNLPLQSNVAKWAAMPDVVAALKAQIVDPREQSRAYAAAERQQTEVAALATDLANQIALRRRTNLQELETYVRGVENAATDKLSFADTQLAIAARYARSAMYADAYLAADLARTALVDADAFVKAAQAQFTPVQ